MTTEAIKSEMVVRQIMMIFVAKTIDNKFITGNVNQFILKLRPVLDWRNQQKGDDGSEHMVNIK